MPFRGKSIAESVHRYSILLTYVLTYIQYVRTVLPLSVEMTGVWKSYQGHFPSVWVEDDLKGKGHCDEIKTIHEPASCMR